MLRSLRSVYPGVDEEKVEVTDKARSCGTFLHTITALFVYLEEIIPQFIYIYRELDCLRCECSTGLTLCRVVAVRHRFLCQTVLPFMRTTVAWMCTFCIKNTECWMFFADFQQPPQVKEYMTETGSGGDCRQSSSAFEFSLLLADRL